MPTKTLEFTPDPLENALLGLEIADECCGDCDDFHISSLTYRAFTPPNEHLADSIEYSAAIERTLAPIADGAPSLSVLIAGATDDGLLAKLWQAAFDIGGPKLVKALDVTVVDRCATPLQICRRFAASQKLKVDLIQDEFENFQPREEFDLILAHGVLSFATGFGQSTLLRQVSGWLSRQGSIIISTQHGQRQQSSHRGERSVKSLCNLDRLMELAKITDPNRRDMLKESVAQGAAARDLLERRFPDTAAIEVACEAALLQLVSLEILSTQKHRRFGKRALMVCRRRTQTPANGSGRNFSSSESDKPIP